MFILTTIADVIPIEAYDFWKSSAKALTDNINEKYANKIIQQVGLCISFYDFLTTSDGLIGHGTGTVNIKVDFRVIVFRPFKGEILEGTIQDASPKGMTISLAFFDDIFIPGPSNLFNNCTYDTNEQVWVWQNEEQQLFFDKHERVRFRVEEEIWTDLAPGDQPPNMAQSETAPPGPRITQVNDEHGQVQGKIHQEVLSEEQKRNMRAWRLVGSMQQGGLGLMSWWASGDEDGEGQS